ncbi:MAG: hypothetical protein CMJ83_04015 [Planctomycetes bacterium]|nr:hypothetical protein [Planctomycetota bacterium]
MRAATSCLILLAAGASVRGQAARPNILFLLTDDQRHDHLGLLHPHLRTAAIDALARRGVRFENAFVTTSICAASRATLLCGRTERTNGFTFRTPPLAARFTDDSWPRRLRAAGYRTGHIGKIGVKFTRGAGAKMFDVLRGHGGPYVKQRGPNAGRHMTDMKADEALAFLDAQPDAQPWALTVSFNAPHAEDPNPEQFIWPPSCDGLYDDVIPPAPPLADPAFFEAQPAFLKNSLNRIRWRWRFDTEEKRRKMVRGYWRMITGVDHAIARIVARVEARGETANTVVVFASDNGYFLGDRGYAGKWLPYEASLRIPMIIVDPRPGRMRPGTRAQTVLNLDLPSTFLDAAGEAAPASYQGRSLMPLVAGATPAWRDHFRFEHRFRHQDIPQLEGVRTSKWKYARYVTQDPQHEELYDLEADPLEAKNLALDRAHASRLDALRAVCDTMREQDDEDRGPAPPARRNAKTRPNVVLIIGDDQHWSDYGFMGSSVIATPHLDRLARQSLFFPRGYVPSSLCCPSLASIITGMQPHRHRITGNEPPRPARGGRNRRQYQASVRQMVSLIDGQATLPRRLRPRGYWSHQSGKWWLGSYRRGGFTHGMTHGDPARGGRHGDHGLTIGRRGLQPLLDFIDAAGERPFFAWYAPFLPHTPHNPPKRLLDQYRGATPSLPVARYRAMCAWFDETCGQLLKSLDARGLTDETIVVFVCDNGWIQRPDRGGFAPRSKRSPYDGGLRTPILVRWPGRITPRRIETPVLSTDIAPTILAACGAERPAVMRGVDLLDLDAVRARDAIPGAVFRHNAVELKRPAANLTHRWLVSGRWKLIVPSPSTSPQAAPELYDVVADPGEQSDLAAGAPEHVRALTQRLDAWWKPR